MKISWFIPEGDHFIRVEEDLVNLSENKLIFAQKGSNYALKSAYNLKTLLISDTLYAFQMNDRLYPIKGSPIFNSEVAMRKYIDVEPEKLKEIIENSTVDLKKEIDKLKNLIQFEVKKNAEEDLKKMDFLQNMDSYRDVLYKKFLEFLQLKTGDVQNEFTDLQPAKELIDQTNKISTPDKIRLKSVDELSPNNNSSTSNAVSKSKTNTTEDKSVNLNVNDSKKIDLIGPKEKVKIRELFR